MDYSHAKAQRAFDHEWAKTEAYFRENGMTEDQIAAMREFDLDVFNSDRRYHEHTVDLSLAESIVVPSPEELYNECTETEWVNLLPYYLSRHLKELKKEKLIAFYYHVVCGLSLTEIGSIFHKDRRTIRMWIRRVYKICEKRKKRSHFCLSRRLYYRGGRKNASENIEN